MIMQMASGNENLYGIMILFSYIFENQTLQLKCLLFTYLFQLPNGITFKKIWCLAWAIYFVFWRFLETVTYLWCLSLKPTLIQNGQKIYLVIACGIDFVFWLFCGTVTGLWCLSLKSTLIQNRSKTYLVIACGIYFVFWLFYGTVTGLWCLSLKSTLIQNFQGQKLPCGRNP